MIEITQLHTDKLAEKDVQPEISPAPGAGKDAPQPEQTKEFKSAGKIIHNEFTYRGVDWLLNSAIGVAFTYWSARTKSGQKYFSTPVSGFFKKILKPVLKSEAALGEGAKWGSMFASIMAGGTAIIPVLMTLENKKVKKGIIHWLDEKWYGKEAVANDPKFKESYRAIDEEPHKGFWIGMGSRILAILPLITLASIPATNKPLIKYIYDPIGKVSKGAAKAVGIKPGKNMLDPLKGALEHIEGDPNIAKQWQSNWDFLHRTIGFDFGLTIFYSILHEFAYKGLAKLGVKETDNDKLQGKQFESAEPAIAPPSSVATEVDAMESSAADGEKAHKHTAFSSRIKPRQALSAPESLHTQKIAAETGHPNLAV